jgi:hypothetical protein
MEGNRSAIDILDACLDEAEDAKDCDFNIICAASGDPFNIVKTVSRLPKSLLMKVRVSLLPLIEELCVKIAGKPNDIPLGKTFKIKMDMKTRPMRTKADDLASLFHYVNDYLLYLLPRGDYKKRWHPDILRYQGGLWKLCDGETPSAEYVNHVGSKSMLTEAEYWMRKPHEHVITSVLAEAYDTWRNEG